MSNTTEKAQLVYCVVRYGQILGVYSKQEDALQLVSVNVAKCSPCDLIIKPVL